MRTEDGRLATVPAARIDNLITTETKDELLVYDTETMQLHHLNRSAAVVWRQCDGQQTVQEIARVVIAELDGDASEGMVLLALRTLDDAGLLVDALDTELAGPRQSRRSLLRKAALAGVAVPAVVSITAPAASEAQTCTSGFESDCTETQCCTGGFTCTIIDDVFDVYWCL